MDRVPLERKVLSENDRIAAELRGRFQEHGVLCVLSKIDPLPDMAAHNGHLTKREQKGINRQQNRISKSIYKDKQ